MIRPIVRVAGAFLLGAWLGWKRCEQTERTPEQKVDKVSFAVKNYNTLYFDFHVVYFGCIWGHRAVANALFAHLAILSSL